MVADFPDLCLPKSHKRLQLSATSVAVPDIRHLTAASEPVMIATMIEHESSSSFRLALMFF